jgi:RNA polymerase sigma-54 factor
MTEHEQAIGEKIIGEINDDGYLESSIDEITQEAKVDKEIVGSVIKKIQQFDPPGICCRDLKECLLLQVDIFGKEKVLLAEIIEKHLDDLQTKNYQAIAKELKLSIEDILQAVKVISALEPKPGRPFAGEEPQYITPDIFIQKVGDDYVILLNEDGLPKLRISPYYRSTLVGTSKGEESPARAYIEDKIRSAIWLIRSIHQRQRTIYRVTKSIVKFQRDFLDKGIAYLKPLILRDVAEDIGMHESTISRVTTNKYVYTPQGMFELKFFFNSSINQLEGDGIASQAVKSKIKHLITHEDHRKPLSDQQIVELLKKENVNIARRTVAKYRDMLNILPSSKRKKVF